MKKIVLYVCETCGYKTKDYRTMREHEASHIGLTLEELNTYQSMQLHISHLREILVLRDHIEIRNRLKEELEKLDAFEKEHNLKTENN